MEIYGCFGGYSGNNTSGTYALIYGKYSISTNEWTWVKGATTANSSGVYGAIGVSAPSMLLVLEWGSATWVINNGDLWMFGGQKTNGIICDNSLGLSTYLNDLMEM